MRTLRVLYVLGHGVLGGIERHVQALVRCMEPADVEAHVCILMEPGEVSDAMEAEGVAVHVLGARSGHAPGLLPRFCRLLPEVKPDIVHFHELHLLPGLAMSLFRRIPLVYSEHCSILDAPNPGATRILWAAVGRRIDHVFPVSRHTGRMLSDHLGIPASRMTAVYNGLDVDHLNTEQGRKDRSLLSVSPEFKIVGGVGRLAAQKDWNAFLQVARHLLSVRDDVRFVVVGDGPLREELHRTAERFGVSGKTRWLGSRRDAFALLHEFDVFLFTSAHEELPTTLLEAFAARTPVAGFIPRGGTTEILRLCKSPPGVFLRQRSPEALAKAVNDLLNNPRQARAMAGRGLEVVREHFNMRKIAARVVDIYRSLVAPQMPGLPGRSDTWAPQERVSQQCLSR